MSKPTAIFSCSPINGVKSSPAFGSRSNGPGKGRTQQPTLTVKEPSPRKCRIQTEVRSSPIGARGTNINVKSKLQITEVPTRMNNREKPVTNPSPRKEQASESNKKDVKKQTSGSKLYGVVQLGLHNSRDNNSTIRRGLFGDASDKSDVPSNINVTNMRSCFERKENKVPSKPPPSPSPSRPKPQTSCSKNNSNNIKGILSSRSKFDSSPSKFRIPTSPSPRSNTPTPQRGKLRRSVSTGTLVAGCASDSPSLVRSQSQHAMTPKLRVRFQDEAPGCFSPVLLDSAGGSADSVVGETTNLTVAVRLRPPFPGEHSVVSVDGRTVKVRAAGAEHCFSYDYCFGSTGDDAASQEQVFDTMVEPLVEAVFQSYNVCLFAYGQTGSGKSYSMMGEEITLSDTVPEKAGIIPRFSQRLFKITESCKEYSSTQIEISYFEIYNEKIHDLLGTSAENGRGAPLRVREHPELGPYVVDLNVRKVSSYKALQDWLRQGNSHKATAATEMNVNSSRSHSIFTITLTQSQDDDRPSVCSKINLVDLAGSERLAHTCASGDRLKEGVSINRSLLTLGKVISSLAENKRGFIPYRESVLTWLLRESLGGNSHTAMLATISPSGQYVEETLSTLRYACQARNIVNTVRINERPHERRIRELTEEIQQLKEGQEKIVSLEEELQLTKTKLAKAEFICSQTEKEVEKLEEEWERTQALDFHADCKSKIEDLERELSKVENGNIKLEREIKELRKECLQDKEEKFEHEIEIKHLKEAIDDLYENRTRDREKIDRLENELNDSLRHNDELKSKNKNLERELSESRMKNISYEKDISEMKSSMVEIKKNSSHDPCESQILMLQTALDEAERFTRQYQEKAQILEKKCAEIEEDKVLLETTKKTNEKDIISLKNALSQLERTSSHKECEEKLDTLKKALAVAKSMNAHVDCENRIFELEMEIRNLQSVTLADHSGCDEKINNLFFAVEKYADENNKLVKQHKEEVGKYTETISRLEDENNKLVKQHKEEVDKYAETISKLEDENNKLVKKHNKEVGKHTEETISRLEDENNKLVKQHKKEVGKYTETISRLEDENHKLVKQHKEEVGKYTETISRLEDENNKLVKQHKKEVGKYTETISRLEDENNKLVKQHKKEVGKYTETISRLEDENHKLVKQHKEEVGKYTETISRLEDENNKLVKQHKKEVGKYTETISRLEDENHKLVKQHKEEVGKYTETISRLEDENYKLVKQHKKEVGKYTETISRLEDENHKLVKQHKKEVGKCTETISRLEDENHKLVKQHKEEVDKYTETISRLEERLSSLTTELERTKNIRNNCQDFALLENQLRLLKNESSKLKKKKVEDEKRISSLEQNVISLTKELLDVKNQLRASVRDKESSESLCAQLQEQLTQQDQKLALSQNLPYLEDNKENNWETPSKVIRRSIAQHSKSKRSVRHSFAMKPDEMQQLLKDAEDVCSRLQIPWVFSLEPEVSTHSWFDVNVRVWDPRTTRSVRFTQDVFLGWLREMKDLILSQSSGHKLFQSASWMQNFKDPEPLPLEPEPVSDKKVTLQEEVASLQERITGLETLCDPRDRHQVLSAITSLGKAVTQLSSKLGLSSPLKPSNTLRKL